MFVLEVLPLEASLQPRWAVSAVSLVGSWRGGQCVGAAREGVSEQCTCGGVRRVRVTALQYCTERVLARFTRRLGFLARRSEAKPEVLNTGGS